MANIKYFSDLPNGETVEFARVDYINRKNIRGFHEGQWIKVNRMVEYKAFASKHVCDVRCMNANGRTMKCECACGGKNHGKGFRAEAAYID